MKTDSSFFEKVYFVVRQIPKGRVCSYGAIAAYIGSPGAARMVGWAMNKSHSMPDIPAHRVVNRNGLLTGKQHFGDNNLMKELLENEGLQVVDDKVVDFNALLWEPLRELNI